MPPSRCVVQNCNNRACAKKGISVHLCPLDNKRRNIWAKFVKAHRQNFDPVGRFVVCSAHFSEDCFERLYLEQSGSQRRLKQDANPTVWKPKITSNPETKRSRRMILKEIVSSSKSASTECLSSTKTDPEDQHISKESPIAARVSEEHTSYTFFDSQDIVEKTAQCENQNLPEKKCGNCSKLTKDKEELQRELFKVKNSLSRKTAQVARNQQKWVQQLSLLHDEKVMVSNETQTSNEMKNDSRNEENDGEDELECDQEVNYYESREDDNSDMDDTWVPENGEQTYNDFFGQNDEVKTVRIDCSPKDIRNEPKVIVFVSQLLLFFQNCKFCFAPRPTNDVVQTGTMITVSSTCNACKQVYVWKSQPSLLGFSSAGNLLLSFAVLTAGGSITKILKIFKHMGILVYQKGTFFKHQRYLLIPSIVGFWRKYQTKVLQSVKGKEVILAGDGRHDSMGHSAKYCIYTIFCCTVGRLIHIELVQANQAGSSTSMEFFGHQKAFSFLLSTGMIIKTFVSDRHGTITKWMREECSKLCKQMKKSKIEHYYDCWHVARSLFKALVKAGKIKGCENINRWRKACIRHFYWSVASSKQHQGDVKYAKFESFLSHVVNQHTNLPNKIFNKCAHSPIAESDHPRLWLTKGSLEYEKLDEILRKPRIVKAIKKSSSLAQTSALEGYHSVINQFAPKMLSYSYLGLLSRTILSALHFNYNLKREGKKDREGEVKLRVSYPKFKEGEGTVKQVKAEQNYEYISEIFHFLNDTPKKDLKKLCMELEKDVPKPLHSMLDKEEKEDSIRKYKERQDKKTVVCPPTCTESELQSLPLGRQQGSAASKRKKPVCHICHKPKKGHQKSGCLLKT